MIAVNKEKSRNPKGNINRGESSRELILTLGMVNPKAEEFKVRGNEALAKQDYPNAIHFYSQSIQHDPTNHVYYSNRSAAYASNGEYQKALEDAQKTVEINPTWSKGYSRLGAALDFLGRKQEAEKAYEKGLEIEPSNTQLKKSLDDIKTRSTQNSNSGFDPTDFSQLFSNPKMMEYAKDESFLNNMRQMIENPGKASWDPRVAEVMSMIQNSKYGQDQYSGHQPNSTSQKPANQQTKAPSPPPPPSKTPTEIEAENEREFGARMYKEKNFDSAMLHFMKAVELCPEDFNYHLNVSAVLFEQEKYDECISKCDEIFQLGEKQKIIPKKLWKPVARKGRCLLKLGKEEEGIKVLEQATKIFPDADTINQVYKLKQSIVEREEKAYHNKELADEAKQKGNTCFKAQNFPEALDHYSEAIKRNPYDPILWGNRAAAHTKLRNYAASIEDCDKSLQLDPKFIKGYLRKAYNFLEVNNPVLGRLCYRKALGLQYDCKEAQDGLKLCEERIKFIPKEEVQRMLMSDPEIHAILSDSTMNMYLQRMQNDPSSIPELLKDPKVSENVKKLIDAGIIETR